MAVQKMAVDLEKIKMAIHSGIPLSITTYTLPREMETYMGDILSAFLTELDQQQMIQYLSYCLSELMTNAKKANIPTLPNYRCRTIVPTKEVYYRLSL